MDAVWLVPGHRQLGYPYDVGRERGVHQRGRKLVTATTARGCQHIATVAL